MNVNPYIVVAAYAALRSRGALVRVIARTAVKRGVGRMRISIARVRGLASRVVSVPRLQAVRVRIPIK